MNELIQQNITELLVLLNTLLKEGVDVARDGLPTLFEQILAYNSFRLILWTSITGGVMGFLIALCVRMHIRDAKGFYISEEKTVLVFIGWVLVIVLGVIEVSLIEVLVEIETAPILYLVEKVSALL